MPYSNLKGGAEMEAALAKLSDKVAGDNLAAAARAGGRVIETKWKQLFRSSGAESVAGAPPRVQTGNYRRSIHTRVIEHTRNRAVAVIGPAIAIGEYPVWLEYGTSRMPAHPIARPAVIQSKDDAMREIEKVLRGALGIGE